MKKHNSFTIIELLVVIAILALFASIVLVAVKSLKDKAERTKLLQFSSQIYHTLGVDVVAKWDFDEGSENQALDSSGNNNHGTIYGATWTDNTPSGEGYALSFDGSNYVHIPDSPKLSPEKITIEVWVYPTQFGWSDVVINKYSSTQQYMLMFYTDTGQILGRVYINGNWRSCITPSNIMVSLGQWSHLVYTYDGTTGTVHLNGEQGCTHSYVGKIPSGNDPLKIGTMGASNFFQGLIDGVRIYSEALSSAQIKNHYAEGLKKRGLVISD